MRDTGRATTRRRDRRYKRKLKKLSETGKRSINIFLIDRDYHYKKINKPYYKKYYIGNRKRAYKKLPIVRLDAINIEYQRDVHTRKYSICNGR